MGAGRASIERGFLYVLLFSTASVLPFLMKKPPRRDWIFAYFWNASTNVLLDKIAVKRGWIAYPTRLLPRLFSIHILFDLLLYPTATVLYNQMTRANSRVAVLGKVLLFAVPLTAIEAWADRHTGLIRWGKGWKWYHTLISVTLKSLWTRTSVELFSRWLNRGSANAKLHER